MSEVTNDKVIMEIKNVCNVRYEQSRDFKTSVLYEVYKRAVAITKEIVNENRNLVNQSSNRKSTGTNRRNSELIYNIMFFEGAKGTGKTSSMLSYMEFLKDYHRIKSRDNIPEELSLGEENIMFTGIDQIEATMVGSKEDILNIVLAKMTTKWLDEERRSYGENGIILDEDYAYKKRKMQKLLQNVYDCLKDSRGQEDVWKNDNDIYMDTLQKLSFTLNLKKAFQEFVESYLEIMEYSDSGNRIGKANRFLVITIDFDEEIESAYELLEQIRKYLMLPRVIVLMSANCEQLDKVYNNHFMHQYRYLKVDDGLEEYVRKLSRESLEKTIPAQRRIVLKAGRDWKYFDRSEIQILYKTSQEKDISYSGTIKKIVRDIYYKYFGMQFGSENRLVAYLAPSTLRETASLIEQTGELEEISTADQKHVEENFEWFFKHEFVKIIQKNSKLLNGSVIKEMEQWSLDIQSNLIKEILERRFEVAKENSLNNLFSKLQLGGIEERKESALCMLYFSAKLAEILKQISVLQADDKKEKMEEFLSYFYGGIWGDWENSFLGDLSKQNAKPDDLLVNVAHVAFMKENEALTLELMMDDNYSEKKEETIISFLDRNANQLKNYQYLLLFYVLDEPKTETLWRKEEWYIRINHDSSGVFSLSNCFINLFNGYELAEKFVKELSSILYTGNDDNAREKIKEHIEKKISIKNEIDEWKKETGCELILPLMNIEYLLQLGNKIEKTFKKMTVAKAEEDIVVSRIKEYFETILNSLKEYSEIYSEIAWDENFKKCPVINEILNKSTFMDMLFSSIERIADIRENAEGK